MPTDNPRVNVTLSPSLHAVVADLARLQRVSKATVLREMLEASEPVLRQVVAMMEAANEMSEEARSKVAKDMERALGSVEGKANKAMALAAGITEDLVAQAEAIRGRRPARGSAPPGRRSTGRKSAGKGARKRKDPPPSNRGVKSTKQERSFSKKGGKAKASDLWSFDDWDHSGHGGDE